MTVSLTATPRTHKKHRDLITVKKGTTYSNAACGDSAAIISPKIIIPAYFSLVENMSCTN